MGKEGMMKSEWEIRRRERDRERETGVVFVYSVQQLSWANEARCQVVQEQNTSLDRSGLHCSRVE